MISLHRDPSIKRDFCKKCSLALTPATSDISAPTDSLVTIKCHNCAFEKKYPINDNYQLWSEKPQAAQDTFEVTE
jgi:RNase P subunit RPR2